MLMKMVLTAVTDRVDQDQPVITLVTAEYEQAGAALLTTMQFYVFTPLTK